MSEARKLTKEYRLKHWSNLIQQRANSGKNVNDWCKEHGISRNSYYYWQRELKLSATYNLDVKSLAEPPVSPAIVPLTPPPSSSSMNTSGTAIAVNFNGLTLEIQEGASFEIIERTLKALKNIC
jgi:putative transposase